MDRDQIAKSKFINSFHNNADKRIKFLLQLYSEDHHQEAMTLCLSYIDSFSQWLQWPGTKSGENFVESVVNFGGDSFMPLVHPLQAVREFNRLKQPWKNIAAKIESIYPGPNYKLQEKQSFITKLTAHFSQAEVHQIETESWRATLAATAYFHLRNPSIHSFGSLELSFSRTTYQGDIVPGIGFMSLQSIASNLHAELRNRSEANNQWFGNDDIVGA
jgi:hypothetical protein